MDYYSTNSSNHRSTFREAVLSGLASDGGLWMPSDLRAIDASGSFQDLAYQIASRFTENDVPNSVLRAILNDALTFDVPLLRLAGNLYALELFHGPTLSFKDFGARFLARLLSFFLVNANQRMTILTATSGDTGSAVASGFFGVSNVRVFLLYPSGKVSAIQEKQMTTWGGNVTALEVAGNFDDCQRMVKQAFQDPELQNLTSANSINIGRLIPQSFYYAHAAGQINQCTISVPCGNLGNLAAGLFARRMGAKIRNFVAATNTNDVFVDFLNTGKFHARAAHPTLSNAMDVGNPSNFARIAALYGSDLSRVHKDILGFSFNDSQTLAAIRELYEVYGYICDPHSAIAYLALKKSQQQGPGIFIATAHPAKFPEIVREACGVEVEIPQSLRACLNKEKQSVQISSDYAALKDLL